MQPSITVLEQMTKTQKSSRPNLKEELEFLTKNYNQGSNFEYLVFKSDGSTISTDFTDAELEKIYETIFTYSFPMNQNPLYASKIKALTDKEKEEMLKFEKRFILGKLKEINPALEILPIPKTMYQLFFILVHMEFVNNKYQRLLSDAIIFPGKEAENINRFIQETLNKTKINAEETEDLNNKVRLKAFFNLYFCPTSYLAPTKDGFFQYCHDFNFFPYIRKIWHLTNTALMKEFKRSIIPKKELILKLCARWLILAAQQLQDPMLKHYLLAKHDGSENLFLFIGPNAIQNQKLLLTLIAKEMDFNQRYPNDYFVYRGGSLESDFNQHIEHHRANKCWATSFSDGLLAGYLNDLNSGCAFYYMTDTNDPILSLLSLKNMAPRRVATTPGYLLRVCKEKNLDYCFIPPIGNIARICGGNELHHVRIKLSKEILTVGAPGTSHVVQSPFIHNTQSYDIHIKEVLWMMHTRAIQIKDSANTMKAEFAAIDQILAAEYQEADPKEAGRQEKKPLSDSNPPSPNETLPTSKLSSSPKALTFSFDTAFNTALGVAAVLGSVVSIWKGYQNLKCDK